MNGSIVWRLIAKDLYLYRWLMAAALAAGFVSLFLRRFETLSDNVALILFLTAIVALGIFIAMYGILSERKEKSALFVLSLPVSPMQYTTAKIVASLIAFLVPWLVLTLTILGLTVAFDRPDGSIPFTVAMMLFFLANFCVLLALILVTGSEYWAIAGILVTNFGVAVYMNVVMNLPGIAEYRAGPVAVWSSTVVAVIAIELAVVAVSLGLAFYLQSRKRDFV